jgi:hypothetical protein
MTEKEIQEEVVKEKPKQKSFWDVVFLPFQILGKIISFIFKAIKMGARIISVIFLIFAIWFGYNFYVVFSDLAERGVDKESAAMEAFSVTLDKTVNVFEKIPNSINIPNPFSNSYSEEERIRELFIETRGFPEAYVLIVSYDKIEEGVPIKREESLRFEVWFYGYPYNKKVVFENGFFKEEGSISSADGLIENSVSPLFFNEKTTKSEVQGVFGAPSCIITDNAGEDVLTTYRFKETENKPLAAVTFMNEKLISATVGVVFLSENEESLCK